MRELKRNNGITLIALIITIIVLLILAVVAISAVSGDGIINHAKNAARKYNQEQQAEQFILDQYEAYLGENWIQRGTSITNGKVTLTVGDTVTNYDESTKEDGTIITGLTNVEWKVLGAENGKILLFSTDDVKTTHQLNGKTGYTNGISDLKTICAEYGQGKFAESARIVTVEDIDRVTGFDPTATGDGKIYNYGKINEYGNEMTYTLDTDGKVVYSGTNGQTGTSTYTKFEHVDSTTLTTDNSITLKSNSYYYYPNTLTQNSSGDIKGIATDSSAYLMLFKEVTNTSKNASYWLGSSAIRTDAGFAQFGIFTIASGTVSMVSMWNSASGDGYGSWGVRAVVCLEAGVKLTNAGTNSWTLSK